MDPPSAAAVAANATDAADLGMRLAHDLFRLAAQVSDFERQIARIAQAFLDLNAALVSLARALGSPGRTSAAPAYLRQTGRLIGRIHSVQRAWMAQLTADAGETSNKKGKKGQKNQKMQKDQKSQIRTRLAALQTLFPGSEVRFTELKWMQNTLALLAMALRLACCGRTAPEMPGSTPEQTPEMLCNRVMAEALARALITFVRMTEKRLASAAISDDEDEDDDEDEKPPHAGSLLFAMTEEGQPDLAIKEKDTRPLEELDAADWLYQFVRRRLQDAPMAAGVALKRFTERQPAEIVDWLTEEAVDRDHLVVDAVVSETKTQSEVAEAEPTVNKLLTAPEPIPEPVVDAEVPKAPEAAESQAAPESPKASESVKAPESPKGPEIPDTEAPEAPAPVPIPKSEPKAAPLFSVFSFLESPVAAAFSKSKRARKGAIFSAMGGAPEEKPAVEPAAAFAAKPADAAKDSHMSATAGAVIASRATKTRSFCIDADLAEKDKEGSDLMTPPSTGSPTTPPPPPEEVGQVKEHMKEANTGMRGRFGFPPSSRPPHLEPGVAPERENAAFGGNYYPHHAAAAQYQNAAVFEVNPNMSYFPPPGSMFPPGAPGGFYPMQPAYANNAPYMDAKYYEEVRPRSASLNSAFSRLPHPQHQPQPHHPSRSSGTRARHQPSDLVPVRKPTGTVLNSAIFHRSGKQHQFKRSLSAERPGSPYRGGAYQDSEDDYVTVDEPMNSSAESSPNRGNGKEQSTVGGGRDPGEDKKAAVEKEAIKMGKQRANDKAKRQAFSDTGVPGAFHEDDDGNDDNDDNDQGQLQPLKGKAVDAELTTWKGRQSSQQVSTRTKNRTARVSSSAVASSSQESGPSSSVSFSSLPRPPSPPSPPPQTRSPTRTFTNKRSSLTRDDTRSRPAAYDSRVDDSSQDDDDDDDSHGSDDDGQAKHSSDQQEGEDPELYTPPSSPPPLMPRMHSQAPPPMPANMPSQMAYYPAPAAQPVFASNPFSPRAGMGGGAAMLPRGMGQANGGGAGHSGMNGMMPEPAWPHGGWDNTMATPWMMGPSHGFPPPGALPQMHPSVYHPAAPAYGPNYGMGAPAAAWGQPGWMRGDGMAGGGMPPRYGEGRIIEDIDSVHDKPNGAGVSPPMQGNQMHYPRQPSFGPPRPDRAWTPRDRAHTMAPDHRGYRDRD